eukprot:4945769-Amphidinium_carterae.1
MSVVCVVATDNVMDGSMVTMCNASTPCARLAARVKQTPLQWQWKYASAGRKLTPVLSNSPQQLYPVQTASTAVPLSFSSLMLNQRVCLELWGVT